MAILGREKEKGREAKIRGLLLSGRRGGCDRGELTGASKASAYVCATC